MTGPSRLVAFGSGLLFAAGLGLSGMTHPSKVSNFLDVAGTWDPSLLCVMGGALAVTVVLFPPILRRRRPVLEAAFHVPPQRPVDARLLVGAALFGAGWGLGGFCPGPALVAIASGARSALVFALAMATGMALFSLLQRRAARPRDAAPGSTQA